MPGACVEGARRGAVYAGGSGRCGSRRGVRVVRWVVVAKWRAAGGVAAREGAPQWQLVDR